MYLKAHFAVVVFAFAFVVPALAARQAASQQSAAPDSNVIECRALEAHATTAPAVLIVIFHQQQKQDQPRLAALIKANSGSAAEIQIGGGSWIKETVFRLRTCFGRGMLVLPSDAARLKDGDTFRIRFAKQAAK